MLGVLKRRWKPKRSANVSRIPGSDSNLSEGDKDKPCRPSVRQVHPVCEDKAHFLVYEKHSVMPELSPNDLVNGGSPPPYPKRASLDSNPSPTQCYPLAPNICVEAGRIQFIKQETEGVQQPPDSLPTPPATPRVCGRVTVTRGLQTDVEDEEFDGVKKSLEDRIQELEIALESVQKNELRDKQTIAKLQKQLARRESAQRDADRERRLRADSESRAKQALQEAARCKSRLKLLTTEFTRMEETVRSMLVYKKQAEQLRQEKNALTLAFENRCQQYQTTINRLNNEILSLRQQLAQVSSETSPEEILQAHAAALHRHAEESRKQYERCLDDVANQVVKALLAQKGLREEVGALNNRIQELESQNRALTSMLVHQLRGDSPPDHDNVSTKATTPEDGGAPTNVVKHYNSFNSEVFDEGPSDNCESTNETALSKFEKRLSTNSEILDTRLSLEDKKRHQVLTKLWTDLKGSEVTPKKLLEALSAVDSAFWVQPQRPVSLNLHLPIVQATKYRRTRPILAQTSSKSEEETTGNESPESGNRDEGYSTMSSDVQADLTRGSGEAIPNRGLEDLKEATDETDIAETRLLVTDNKDPDILYIPFNLLNLKPRNSYPPGKDMLPFQHIMRSFSDSHLCIKITTAPSPCYTFSSPISSSPSIFLLDITDKNPLRRAKATSTLWGTTNFEICDDKASQISWSSAAEERLECTTWDAEYIQQWLRLDETRSALQQHHRDMLELEYDRAELEDWSLSLSNDDLREQYKRVDVLTPGQISISTLPSIQENNALELEEDSNECLWNDSSYMMDKEGRELMTLLMDHGECGENEKPWPYAVSANQQISPDNSWSSGSDCCHSHEPETCSKRSSAALSGCSDDTGELPAVGTDFTRDFYRLVKFESTKSLASTSSRSLGGALSDAGDPREATLHNVLNFLAEQQKYVAQKESPRPCSASDLTKDFSIEGPPQRLADVKICESDVCLSKPGDDENYVTLKQLCDEHNSLKTESDIKANIAYADEVCLVTPLDVESENCSDIGERPVDICSSVSVELNASEYQKVDESLTASETSTANCTSESLASSVSTPETVVSKIPRRKQNAKLASPAKKSDGPETKIPKSKIPHKKAQKMKAVEVRPHHVITSERLPQCSAGVISDIIDGPPHRAVSFHERATSKDVIDELNRMIKNGDESVTTSQEQGEAKLDQACRTTGWVHVEKDIDLTDPKARANLLDVMMASVSSDSSPTSSCGGSVASDSTEDPPDYGHLHRIHRFHRQKKANAARPELAVVRAASVGSTRPTIIGRPDFFVRYGEKEMEAVASFDFLDDFSTTSSSLSCSIDESAEIDEDFKEVVQLKVSQV